MGEPTLDELRELSTRSRATQRASLAALVAALLLFPAQLALAPWIDASALAVGGLALAGAVLVRAAHVAGQERGAYRRVFRRIRAARAAARKE